MNGFVIYVRVSSQLRDKKRWTRLNLIKLEIQKRLEATGHKRILHNVV